MGVEHRIIADGSLVVIRYLGNVTAKQITLSQEKYFLDPRFRLGIPELAIMDEVGSIEMNHQEVGELLASVSTMYSSPGFSPKISIFAPNDLPYGMSRMFQTLAELRSKFEVGVHRTEQDALGWLGRSEQKLSELLY